MPTQYVSKLCTTVATKMTCMPSVETGGGKEGGVQTSETGAVLFTFDVCVTAESAEAPHETPCCQTRNPDCTMI